MKYGVSNWIYGEEALEVTMARLQGFGYDGVELMAEPSVYDSAHINRLRCAHGLKVLSLAGMYPWPTEGAMWPIRIQRSADGRWLI